MSARANKFVIPVGSYYSRTTLRCCSYQQSQIAIFEIAMRCMRPLLGHDDTAIAELRSLARNDGAALEQAMRTGLAQPTTLAIRHHAIELLAGFPTRIHQPPELAPSLARAARADRSASRLDVFGERWRALSALPP